MSPHLQDYLRFAVDLAREAGDGLLSLFLGNFACRTKVDGSEVTDADVIVESAIRARIELSYPSHGILGEEFGLVREKSRHRWLVDPLDGTRWFVLGVPIFGILIALIEDGEPVLGVIHFPATSETIYAGKGLGCWYIGQTRTETPLHVAEATSLSCAIVSASGIHGSTLCPGPKGEVYDIASLIHRSRQFSFCGDCLQYALLCRGRIHMAIDTLMKPWDIAALVPCIEEAGGVVAGLDGRRDDIIHAGNLIAASNILLLNEGIRFLTNR